MKKYLGILFALVLAVSLMLVPAAVSADPGAEQVVPIVFERTFTPGVSTAEMSFATDPTILGINSVALNTSDLQNCHEGIKIAVDSPFTKLDEFTMQDISCKARGQFVKRPWATAEGEWIESPGLVVIIDLGQDVDGHGRYVTFDSFNYYEDQDLPGEDPGWGHPTAPIIEENSEWVTILPVYGLPLDAPAGWFVDGYRLDVALGIGTEGVWPEVHQDLAAWHTALAASDYSGYTVKYIGIRYGMNAIWPEGHSPDDSGVVDDITAYVDSLVVKGVTYDFEPPSGAVHMIATYPAPVLGISVSPASVSFGDVEPGEESEAGPVIITNTGTVPEDFSAALTNISMPDVYTAGLTIADTVTEEVVLVSAWGKLGVPEQTSIPEQILLLTVPEGTLYGTYTATLVFWAELPPPSP